jgi:hypothetical protein
LTPIVLAACVIALSSCGGDDDDQAASRPDTTQATQEQQAPETETSTSPETETQETETETDGETETEGESGGGTGTEAQPPTNTSPEKQPGGTGDEEPAHSLVRLTGRNASITPRLVRVPPFIVIRVELRSDDGLVYGLRCGNVGLQAGGQIGSSTKTLRALRPGRSIKCLPAAAGAGNRVLISATAQPGP